MKLAGRVAIVTGSSRGIGKDIALAFAAEGADIVVAARSETAPDPRLPGTIYDTARAVEALGRRALPVKTDVTNEEEVAALVQRTRDTFGRIDVLVNNAAVLVPRGIVDLPSRHLDLHYRVNLKGPILCIRAVLPVEYQAQGISVNVLSPEGRVRTPGNVFGMTPPGGTPEPFETAEAMGKAAVFIASQPPQSFTGNILFDEEMVQQHQL